MIPQLRIGGSFAPPLTDEKLAAYGVLAASAPGPVKDAMTELLACCEKWWNLPEPNGTAVRPHPVGVGAIVSLQENHAKELSDLIPWTHELKAMQELFDALPSGSTSGEEVLTDGVRWAVVTDPEAKALRDAAFHLLWHVKELDLDREPLTADQL